METCYLTEREKEVIKLLFKGYTNSQISDELTISVHTTKAHLESIYYKLNAKNRLQAVIKAMSSDIIDATGKLVG